jgi:hypothetical protein
MVAYETLLCHLEPHHHMLTKGLVQHNGFRTETMYDCYIVMKSMFLVVKLSSHSFIVYVSIIILLL